MITEEHKHTDTQHATFAESRLLGKSLKILSTSVQKNRARLAYAINLSNNDQLKLAQQLTQATAHKLSFFSCI